MQWSLSASDASKKILCPERQLILPSVCTKEALSVEIETFRLNGQATMEMIETLDARSSSPSADAPCDPPAGSDFCEVCPSIFR
jgi:hypothetical protein